MLIYPCWFQDQSTWLSCPCASWKCWQREAPMRRASPAAGGSSSPNARNPCQGSANSTVQPLSRMRGQFSVPSSCTADCNLASSQIKPAGGVATCRLTNLAQLLVTGCRGRGCHPESSSGRRSLCKGCFHKWDRPRRANHKCGDHPWRGYSHSVPRAGLSGAAR